MMRVANQQQLSHPFERPPPIADGGAVGAMNEVVEQQLAQIVAVLVVDVGIDDQFVEQERQSRTQSGTTEGGEVVGHSVVVDDGRKRLQEVRQKFRVQAVDHQMTAIPFGQELGRLVQQIGNGGGGEELPLENRTRSIFFQMKNNRSPATPASRWWADFSGTPTRPVGRSPTGTWSTDRPWSSVE